MQFRDVELRGIPVVTKSGQKLGKLAAYVIDVEHHEIAQYVVSGAGLLSKLMPDELLVGREQVITLDNEQMVVHDAVVEEKAEAKSKQMPGTANVTPAAMARIEEMLRGQKTPTQ